MPFWDFLFVFKTFINTANIETLAGMEYLRKYSENLQNREGEIVSIRDRKGKTLWSLERKNTVEFGPLKFLLYSQSFQDSSLMCCCIPNKIHVVFEMRRNGK